MIRSIVETGTRWHLSVEDDGQYVASVEVMYPHDGLIEVCVTLDDPEQTEVAVKVKPT